MGKEFLSPYFALTSEFIDSDVVDYLMQHKDGAKYIILFMHMCIMASKTDGRLVYQINGSEIPYNAVQIQRKAKHYPLSVVNMALITLREVGLIDVDKDNIISIPEFEKYCGEYEE